jgi:hypothetical protein
MEKLVYVVWKKPDLSARQFRERMLGEVAPRLAALGVHGLSMNLVDEHVEYAAAMRLTRFDPPPAGTVSLWLDLADERGPLEGVLDDATERKAGYLVVESVPLRNTTHPAPLGQRVPGTNMVALIERPERIRTTTGSRTGTATTNASRSRRSALTCTFATSSCAL